jgi:hypothetical protein
MADLANISAAQSAGYTDVRLDRGAGTHETNRYLTTLEKWLVGAGQGGFLLRAYGESSSSADAADTVAVASLNAQRAQRYARHQLDRWRPRREVRGAGLRPGGSRPRWRSER